MPLGGKNILLVDDDQDLRILITVALRDTYTIFGCDSAEAAMVRVQGTSTFDLLIVDIMLPGMSGLDFVKKVRTIDKLASVPILMITSKLGDDMRQQARAAGASAFVFKPFTIKEIKESIGKLLVEDPTEKLMAAFAQHEKKKTT